MPARRPPRCYAPLAPLLLLLLLPLVGVARGAGVFELQVLEWSHWSRQLAGGACCAGGGAGGGPCVQPCAASFALCLREYQAARAPSQPNAPCSFGRAVSPPLGPDSITEPLHTLALRFSFRWTRSFTLLLSAYAQDGASTGDNSTLIEEAWWAGMVEAGGPWQALVWTGSRARLTYRVRVQCAANYYSATCTVFCRARDDAFGHYTCSETGTKTCLPGWTGDNCETPICKEGCHPIHGRCDQPGDCICRPGWRGDLCAQCAPYPGCKHGYCNGSAWDCTCDTNWGGILCDQDLNYCGTHEPCRNGGVCENTAPDQYRCTCADGFSGQHCERAEHACAPRPCAHGVCELTATPPHFRCECEPGWAGTRCDKDVDDCASAPCRNGATCRDRLAGYSCDCAPGWTGHDCEQDIDECGDGLGPCVNALSCSNKAGGYECACVAGWEGPDCDVNVDDCASSPCRRGATCIDLVDSFHCACAPGYEGRLCDVDTDECASSPCRHGGECRDLLDAYDCICPLPYAGRDCEDERDWCASSPCANGATCYSARDDYYCHCASSHTGRNCTQPRALTYGGACVSNPCRNNGTCVPADGDGDYSCSCVDGWIGKTCSVRAEEAGGCGAHVCSNGGTCVRDGEVWRCVCAAGWRGEDCTQPAPCRCLHGGECIHAQGGWTCACPAVWGGPRCERALDGCAAAPCRNGARCVGGAGWFVCECAQGWAGEDCSVPAACPACPPPAVCLTDAAGAPRCVCPAHPPRLAQRCLEALGETEVGEEWGAGCPANTTWWWGCNVCACSATGPARCSRLWCGLPDCRPPATLPCRPDEVCVPTPPTLCVVPPCGSLGECRRVSGRRVEAPPLPAPATCWPGAASTEPHPARCARARLLLARERLSLGAHVERACGSLRRSLALALWPRTPALALLCDIPTDDEDALDLALWAEEEEDAESALRDAIRALSELVGARSLRHHALLGAATALRLAPSAPPAPQTSTPVAAPIAAVAVTLIIAAAAGAAFWIRHKRNNAPPRPSCDEEKSNNLQNEENLRRYANPLREPPAPSVPRALYKAHNNTQDKRLPPEPLAVLV